MKDFMIGCNFWDSKSGTDMWLNFDEESLANKPMKCLNSDIALTLHEEFDGYYAVAVNYMNETADSEVSLADGWKLEPVYGDFTAVEGCGMAVGKIVKK